jgi:hypothetical protein
MWTMFPRKGDRLSAEMKMAATLKEDPQICAECAQLKAKVTRLAKALDDAIGFLAAAETTMHGFGRKYDDRTIIEKHALDTNTILSKGRA